MNQYYDNTKKVSTTDSEDDKSGSSDTSSNDGEDNFNNKEYIQNHKDLEMGKIKKKEDKREKKPKDNIKVKKDRKLKSKLEEGDLNEESEVKGRKLKKRHKTDYIVENNNGINLETDIDSAIKKHNQKHKKIRNFGSK